MIKPRPRFTQFWGLSDDRIATEIAVMEGLPARRLAMISPADKGRRTIALRELKRERDLRKKWAEENSPEPSVPTPPCRPQELPLEVC
jgi:hypothetical protein